MARFIIGRSMRKAAADRGWLRHVLWYLDFLVISAMLWVFRLLPLDASSRLGQRVGRWLGPRLEKNRHLQRNLELAFPEYNAAKIDQLSRDIWGNGGALLAEYTQMKRLCGQQFEQRIEVRGAEHVEAFKSPGVAAVFVTAHLGNWELIGAAIARLGAPINCLYSPPNNPWLDRRLMRERSALGIGLLSRDVSTRTLLRDLQQGHSLGVVMDRRVDSGEPLVLFGHEKPTTLVPARLALKLDCQLVPVQVERLEGVRFRVTFHPPLQPREPQADKLERARDLSRQINGLFVDWIRQAPQDWLCTKRLWDKNATRAAQQTSDTDATPSLRRAS